jgi:glycosyltransferase involved in cell wall biosynthesis
MQDRLDTWQQDKDWAVRWHWLGNVDDVALAQLYQQAWAVVLPSWYEGFALTVLEALRYGRPLLASSAGSVPEVAQGCATLLPPDDPQAWADVLLEWWNDPAAYQQARQQAQRFEQQMLGVGWEQAVLLWPAKLAALLPQVNL